MSKLRRKLFSQNFLHSRKLVKKLIRNSSIGKNDLVLEVGPGKGIITEQLLHKSQHVLAIEIDSYWHEYLKNKFNDNNNSTLYHEDILTYQLPSLPYKVFANIPFSIEGKIIRLLIDAKNPPEDSYLIMMKEVAYRLSAPDRDNMFSIMHKPWFDFSIYHHFKREDFSPMPSVHAVMLRFTKKITPLVSWEEKSIYQNFVTSGFGQGQPIAHNLKSQFGKKNITNSLHAIGIQKDCRPSYVSLELWLKLYKILHLGVY